VALDLEVDKINFSLFHRSEVLKVQKENTILGEQGKLKDICNPKTLS
jgi:hypothetical protein